MNGIATTVWAIIIFATMIFVHELGHFITAKCSGIFVEEFAIGMGPAIFKKRGKETLYAVRLLPLGGFCKLEGEDGVVNSETSFAAKPVWIRFMVAVAGSVMNILLGLILAVILFSSSGQTGTNIIDAITPNSAAEQAGLQVNDKILKLNGGSVHTYFDLKQEIARIDASKSVDVVVERDGNRIERDVYLTANEKGQRVFGFAMKTEKTTFGTVMRDSFYLTTGVTKLVVWSVKQLFIGKVSVNEMSGPVGIVTEIGNAASLGIPNLIMLTILLTVNLGVMNMLPIPGLDGGRIFFLLIEAVRRKPIPPEKEGWIHFAGFVLLIVFSVFILFNDVIKLIG